jgi:hypothetical protein
MLELAPSVIVGVPATLIVTSSAGPGKAGLLDQLAGLVQVTPSPAPVQLTGAATAVPAQKARTDTEAKWPTPRASFMLVLQQTA